MAIGEARASWCELGLNVMQDETIKLKIKAPRIEIALGSLSDTHPGPGPYVAVAMLHTPDGEALYQPLVSTTAPEGSLHLDTDAAADLLAEIYDFVCQRWGPAGTN
jgi:hypothetical protein